MIRMPYHGTACVRLLSTRHSAFPGTFTSTFLHSQRSQRGIESSGLSKPLPPGTWDSHMHVVEPDRFPLDAQAKYKTHPHTLRDARTFLETLGIQNMVIVQPSIYGNDNSCTLDALRQLTPQHGRAVVQFDPAAITPETLQEWHDIGVRGVRVNLVSVGRTPSTRELTKELLDFARVIRPYDWVLQIYMPLAMTATLEEIVPDLGVKVCVDHFGQPSLPSPYDPTRALDPYDLPGFKSLVSLLQGHVWVKMSAPYRISKDPQMRDLDPIGRELISKASNRVVYSTDWPHTRFEGIDSKPFIEKCFQWSMGRAQDHVIELAIDKAVPAKDATSDYNKTHAAGVVHKSPISSATKSRDDTFIRYVGLHRIHSIMTTSVKILQNGQVEIATARLLLRGATTEDAEALFEIYSNAQVMQYWSFLPHKTIAETEALVTALLANPSNGATEFVICHKADNHPIGKIGIWHGDEIGFLLNRTCWGNGLAREAMDALLPYLFGDRGFDMITADVDPHNHVSLRLLGSYGFQIDRFEEKTLELDGEWFDSFYLSLTKTKWQARSQVGKA